MNQIFIEGDKINLCVPQEEDFNTWANWFNDQNITRYLEQGKFPHTVQQQKEFYLNSIKSHRFLTLIKDKENNLLGVISLSEINYEKSSCQIALVCPVKSKTARYAALEAMALVTQHAFERIGINRVWAGQAYPSLNRWSQHLELIGFKTEGILRKAFVHGSQVTSSILISITKDDFQDLIARRDGSLWPGESKTKFLLSKINDKLSLANSVSESLQKIYTQHYKILDDLEKSYEE